MKHRILIADDDIFFQQFLGLCFDPERYTVVKVSDGGQALRLLGRGEFDVLIIDYHVPGLDGGQVLAAMQERDIRTPVIVITGDETIEAERRARASGVAAFFTKPLDRDDLVAVVEKALAVSQTHAQQAGGPTVAARG